MQRVDSKGSFFFQRANTAPRSREKEGTKEGYLKADGEFFLVYAVTTLINCLPSLQVRSTGISVSL
ncbi:MAG: hypothetical protein GX894_06980 [Clostridia bacterium]|nr:hypothetical protein [Clostridia bacterium]